MFFLSGSKYSHANFDQTESESWGMGGLTELSVLAVAGPSLALSAGTLAQCSVSHPPSCFCFP